jgi:hypothetical protein
MDGTTAPLFRAIPDSMGLEAREWSRRSAGGPRVLPFGKVLVAPDGASFFICQFLASRWTGTPGRDSINHAKHGALPVVLPSHNIGQELHFKPAFSEYVYFATCLDLSFPVYQPTFSDHKSNIVPIYGQ